MLRKKCLVDFAAPPASTNHQLLLDVPPEKEMTIADLISQLKLEKAHSQIRLFKQNAIFQEAWLSKEENKKTRQTSVDPGDIVIFTLRD